MNKNYEAYELKISKREKKYFFNIDSNRKTDFEISIAYSCINLCQDPNWMNTVVKHMQISDWSMYVIS